MQRSEWESLRQDIENITREFNISSGDFKPLGIHDKWEEIEGKIYQVFCRIDHPTKRPIWLWEYFKLDTSSLTVEYPFLQLKELVDPEEEVWFFVNGDKDKFYQGKITAILKVILESSYIDELYLASKKYDWLICINHHHILIATGQTMAERVRHISADNAE